MKEVWEGSLILERLQEIGTLDKFYLAIDSDNLDEVTRLLEEAGVDNTSINQVVAMILDGEH